MASPSGQQELPPPAHRRRAGRERLRTALLIAVAILITLFAVLNLDQVKIHWIVATGHAPLIIVIVISVLLGVGLDRGAIRRGRRR